MEKLCQEESWKHQSVCNFPGLPETTWFSEKATFKTSERLRCLSDPPMEDPNTWYGQLWSKAKLKLINSSLKTTSFIIDYVKYFFFFAYPKARCNKVPVPYSAKEYSRVSLSSGVPQGMGNACTQVLPGQMTPSWAGPGLVVVEVVVHQGPVGMGPMSPPGQMLKNVQNVAKCSKCQICCKISSPLSPP